MALKKTTKSTGTELTALEKRMAERAVKSAEAVATAGSTSKSISTRAGRFSINGSEVEGNILQVVVLGWVFDNHLYDEDFDADNPVPPICFAFGDSYKTMAPIDADVSDKKHDSCYTCPFGGKDAWGTADKGKGKACKNARRLIVMSQSDFENNIADAETYRLNVSVMSGKEWDGYVKKIQAHNRDPAAVITEISIIPDAKSQFKLKFEMLGLIEDEFLNEVLDKADTIHDELHAPYASRSEEEEKPAGRGAGKAMGKNAKAPAKAPAGRRR